MRMVEIGPIRFPLRAIMVLASVSAIVGLGLGVADHDLALGIVAFVLALLVGIVGYAQARIDAEQEPSP